MWWIGAGIVLAALFSAGKVRSTCVEEEYLKNDELLVRLDNLTALNPSIASVYNIGQSVRGNMLRVLKLTAAPNDALVPQVKLIGGIHGDQPPSTHVLVNFAKYLIEGYNSGERVTTWILKNTRIHMLPRLNPDGFEEALEGECSLSPGRKNANGYDLNRAFPQAQDTRFPAKFQPEIEAVMTWSDNEKFVLSAGLFTGALVAVYPLDLPLQEDHDVFTKPTTPDEDVFYHLAKTYADNHRSMTAGIKCQDGQIFREGVTNGAQWFRAAGSMMDYNYFFGGTMEISLELYCCKYPNPRLLCHIWDQNKLPLLKYVAESIRGVRGVITAGGIPAEMATVSVVGRDMVVSTNSKGQYFRILLPGNYQLQFEMTGMETKTVDVVVEHQGTAFFTWTEVNVDLESEEYYDDQEYGGTSGSEVSEQTSVVTFEEVTSVRESSNNSSSTRAEVENTTSRYDRGGIDPVVHHHQPTDTDLYTAEESTYDSYDEWFFTSWFSGSSRTQTSTLCIFVTAVTFMVLNI